MGNPTRESQVEDTRCFLAHVREEGLHYTAENRRLLDPALEQQRLAYLAAGKAFLRAIEEAAK